MFDAVRLPSVGLALALALSACGREPSPPAAPAAGVVEPHALFQPLPDVAEDPADNIRTAERVELGHMLFFERSCRGRHW